MTDHGDETTRRDRVGVFLACLMLCAGLAGLKLAGWLEVEWWLVLLAPVLSLAAEALFFLPAAIAGTLQRHFRRT